MSQKERLHTLLTLSRGFAEQLFQRFQTPQEWTTQLFPGANHPLWVAGHLGFADNFALGLLAPDRVEAPQGYRELFGMGSQPQSDPAAYPPVDQVLEFMRSRRRVLLDVLQETDEAALENPLPEGAPEMLSTVGDVFAFIAWHEGLHVGQVTVADRRLGHKPLVG